MSSNAAWPVIQRKTRQPASPEAKTSLAVLLRTLKALLFFFPLPPPLSPLPPPLSPLLSLSHCLRCDGWILVQPMESQNGMTLTVLSKDKFVYTRRTDIPSNQYALAHYITSHPSLHETQNTQWLSVTLWPVHMQADSTHTKHIMKAYESRWWRIIIFKKNTTSKLVMLCFPLNCSPWLWQMRQN